MEETKRADSHGDQANDHRLFIAQGIHYLRGREGKQKVTSEKSKLNEHDLGVIQIKDALKVRDKDVIQGCNKTPEEEQNGHHRKSGGVALVGTLFLHGRCISRTYICHESIRLVEIEHKLRQILTRRAALV